jgi:hypothetical protein
MIASRESPYHSPVGLHRQRHGSPLSNRAFPLQKIFPDSAETEGRKGDSLSADRRGLLLATATAAMMLAASLCSKDVRSSQLRKADMRKSC